MKLKLPVAVLALIPAAGLGGCGNYSFREARRGDGKYDLKKLIADREKEKASLSESSWLPLVHYRTTGFFEAVQEARGGHYPPGHNLLEDDLWGPFGIFFAGRRESHYDLAGVGYEVVEARSLLWGLWQDYLSLVRTERGTREERQWKFLILPVGIPSSVRYQAGEKSS